MKPWVFVKFSPRSSLPYILAHSSRQTLLSHFRVYYSGYSECTHRTHYHHHCDDNIRRFPFNTNAIWVSFSFDSQAHCWIHANIHLAFSVDADAQSANPSTSPPSTATAKPTCLMANLPGSTPTSMGNANLVGIPGPAAYPIRGNMLAFSFGGNISVGVIGRTALNSGSPITEELAFYHSTIDSQTAYQHCDGFGLGYLYHVTSGLCITGQVTSNMPPKFEDSELHLDYRDTCGELPVQAQLFCARRIVLGVIGDSMAFVGDSDTGEQYYGIGDFDEGTEIALLELMHSRGIHLSWD